MISPGYTQPSGKKLEVGRLIRFEGRDARIDREDDDFFYVVLLDQPSEAKFPKDNSTRQAQDLNSCPLNFE